MKEKLARAEVAGIESGVRDIKGAKVLSAQVAGMDREQLRTMVDSLRVKWKTAVVIWDLPRIRTSPSWWASPRT